MKCSIHVCGYCEIFLSRVSALNIVFKIFVAGIQILKTIVEVLREKFSIQKKEKLRHKEGVTHKKKMSYSYYLYNISYLHLGIRIINCSITVCFKWAKMFIYEHYYYKFKY